MRRWFNSTSQNGGTSKRSDEGKTKFEYPNITPYIGLCLALDQNADRCLPGPHS